MRTASPPHAYVIHRAPFWKLWPISHPTSPSMCCRLGVDAAENDASKAKAAYQRAARDAHQRVASAQSAVAEAESKLAAATDTYEKAQKWFDAQPATAKPGTEPYFIREAARTARNAANQRKILTSSALKTATKARDALLASLPFERVEQLKKAWGGAEVVLAGKQVKLKKLQGKVAGFKRKIASARIFKHLGGLLSSLLTLYEYQSLVAEQRASGALFFVACDGVFDGPFCK